MESDDKTGWDDSPWEYLGDEIQRSAEQFNELRNELRRGFRPLQQEAHETYVRWYEQDDPLEDAASEETSRGVQEFFGRLWRWFAGLEKQPPGARTLAFADDGRPGREPAVAPHRYVFFLDESAGSAEIEPKDESHELRLSFDRTSEEDEIVLEIGERSLRFERTEDGNYIAHAADDYHHIVLELDRHRPQVRVFVPADDSEGR